MKETIPSMVPAVHHSYEFHGISNTEWFIIGASLISILFGMLNAWLILRVRIIEVDEEVMELKDDKHMEKFRKMNGIAKLIADGAATFLWQEYVPVGIFVGLFCIIIAFTVEKELG